VLRVGAVVLKLHRPGTDPAALGWRLVAASRARGLLAPPVRLEPVRVGDRLLTGWGYGEPVDPAALPAAPWPAAGRLLARLHAVPPGPGAPATGAPVRVRRALRRAGLGTDPGLVAPRAAVRRAAAALPAGVLAGSPAPGRPVTLTHGDWHLGQLARLPAGWRLLDVDELGVGDPGWDLAWVAAWYAVGVLPAAGWEALLAGYRAAGGPAVPGGGDPWPVLDPWVRAATVQRAAVGLAAAAVAERSLDEVEIAFVDACRRMIAH
jgi:aminoglycoside phosphotransferase (APT) family kinase protein